MFCNFRFKNKFQSALIKQTSVAISTSLLTFSAVAEDIEIYTGQVHPRGKPNVLFILDTSASMSSQVTITTNYDPAIDYSGACNDARIYWKRKNQDVPSCNSSQWFSKSQFRCLTAETPLDMNQPSPGAGSVGTGVYTDRITRYKSSKQWWYPLSANVHTPSHVECHADQPANNIDSIHSAYHGAVADDGEPYIRNGPAGAGTPYDHSWSFFNWLNNRWSKTYTLYTGNYLNWWHNHSTTTLETRLGIVKQALKHIIDSTVGIRIGLMQFNLNSTTPQSSSNSHETHGGSVIFPLSDIDGTIDGTPNGISVRDAMKNTIDDMSASGNSPMSETLSEAYRYWTGAPVHYGNTHLYHNNIKSTAGSRDGSENYVSPFKTDCSRNFQIILTDGQPTADQHADVYLNNLMQNVNVNDADNETRILDTSCAHGSNYSPSSNSCFDHVAEYMNKVDLTPDDNPDIDQTVSTYTVGFDLSTNPDAKALLKSAAKHGGGQYFDANNAQDLAAAFNEAITQILEIHGSFSSPAISVNAFNKLIHNDEIYFALFEPGQGEHWPGNIKRYKLMPNRNDPGDFNVVDMNAINAIDPDTAQIKQTTKSWWKIGTEPDGNKVTEGGLAKRLFDYHSGSNNYNADSRKGKVFTYVDNYDFSDFTGSGIPLVELKEELSLIHI